MTGSLISPRVDYASDPARSRGRFQIEPESRTRTPFQRDRDRIIHSKAFRRLKHKTQVFVSSYSDHYRSRLTHTIEVAQISRHLSRLLQLNEDLSECIALAHDLGHSPFGHSGERELNRLLSQHGGFEHNLHSLKIVEKLEKKYPTFDGLNLSFEVLEGLKKHLTPWDKPKLDPSQKVFITLEAQIANIADEIAYNNHDLDDGLSSGLLDPEHLLSSLALWQEANAKIKEQYANLEEHQRHHLINSYLISAQVTDVFTHSSQLIQDLHLQSLDDVQHIDYQLITFNPEMQEKNNQLRRYLHKHLYKHPDIQLSNERGDAIITALFKHFQAKPELLPSSFLSMKSPDYPIEQVIGDYIANMTDKYASKLHQSLLSAA